MLKAKNYPRIQKILNLIDRTDISVFGDEVKYYSSEKIIDMMKEHYSIEVDTKDYRLIGYLLMKFNVSPQLYLSFFRDCGLDACYGGIMLPIQKTIFIRYPNTEKYMEYYDPDVMLSMYKHGVLEGILRCKENATVCKVEVEERQEKYEEYKIQKAKENAPNIMKPNIILQDLLLGDVLKNTFLTTAKSSSILSGLARHYSTPIMSASQQATQQSSFDAVDAMMHTLSSIPRKVNVSVDLADLNKNDVTVMQTVQITPPKRDPLQYQVLYGNAPLIRANSALITSDIV